MILLDELDAKEKEIRYRDSLPPYSPRRSFRLPNISPRNANASHPNSSNATLHPRSASLASVNYAGSQPFLTLNSNASSQTLLALPLPTPPPSATLTSSSTSQLSAPYTSPLASLPAPPAYPPSHIRPSNNVYVQRNSAAITGAFLIDPALQVPDCLLPDEPDILLVAGKESGKSRRKRTNVCLVTNSGDISADIWIREGCVLHSKNRIRGHVRASSVSGSSFSGSSGRSRRSLDSTDPYWASDWTSPPPSMPWPEKTKEHVDIVIRSQTGTINVRIFAQSHQSLRIHARSTHGTIAIGVPRTFVGQVQSNAGINRSDSASTSFSLDSSSSLPPLVSPSYSNFPGLSNEKEKSREKSSIAEDLVGGIVQELTQALPMSARQPVQFSFEMEGAVTALSEHRRTAKGRYFAGPKTFISERMDHQSSDELHLETNTGIMGVFYSDELPQQKTDGIITKLLNKNR